jgi:hypothetical protein
VKDEHTYCKKMARNGHNIVIYKGTFISNQSLNLGCECQTIIISLKNGALTQSSKQGIYQRAGKVNGKTSWISSSNNNALWYNAAVYDWMIGSLDDLGANFGGISSTGNQGRSSCPYNVPNDAWEYWNNAWIFAGANDVSIKCLTGNDMF